MTHYLNKLVAEQKNGNAVGITSVCSSNPFVIRAALEHTRDNNRYICIESTGRQVNQDGGYAGMTPKEFAGRIRQVTEEIKADTETVILGGDHIGPDAWHFENAAAAMDKACQLVRQCVFAGFRKLHLDPSMPCRDDIKNGHPYISLETIANRTAMLCKASEEAAVKSPGKPVRPVYVVGAEVPAPGGLSERENPVRISSVERIEQTIATIHHAFTRNGLNDAWNRCIAVVAETGANFGPEIIYDYDEEKTTHLKQFIRNQKRLVFEAHSTDFQTLQALSDMVRNQFAILKVGPWLTFAVREVLFAMATIEQTWRKGRKSTSLSRLPEIMASLMQKNPAHWKAHYSGDTEYINYLAAFGFSDRIRYYWSLPEAVSAVKRLFHNLEESGIPLPLLSQYLPEQYEAVREGRISCTPDRLIYHKLSKVLDQYATACGQVPDEHKV